MACRIPEAELTPYVTRFGPVGRVLQDAPPELRHRVGVSVRDALSGYVEGSDVHFNGACFLIRAEA